MGTCFGRCVSKEAHATTSASCLWPRHATDEQEAELMSNASDNNKKCQRPNFIFRIIKFKSKRNRHQFIDKFWEQQDMRYSKLNNRNGTETLSEIQLQNLDVHNLLNNTALPKEESALNQRTPAGDYTQMAMAVSSRASSSLDLEWEHEYAQMLTRHHPHQQLSHHRMPFHSAADQQQLHAATQALLGHSSSSNNNLSSSRQDTPSHQSSTSGSGSNNNNSNSLYDNQLTRVQLHDSWQYLSNDEDPPQQQLNAQSRSQSQSQSLSVPYVAAAGHSRERQRNVTRSSSKHQQQAQQQQAANALERRNSSITRTSSHASWSHISTPESLEWDQDEEQQRQLRVEDDNLDHETLELLHQIEQLKNRVLDETGDGLFDDATATAQSATALAEVGDGIEFVAHVDKYASYSSKANNIS